MPPSCIIYLLVAGDPQLRVPKPSSCDRCIFSSVFSCFEPQAGMPFNSNRADVWVQMSI